MKNKTAVIIGAGPAGLTAAYELLIRTDIKPIIYEMSQDIGGISKTVNYKGNRIDIGGHRFFSKSDRVMNWWQNMLPIQGFSTKDEVDQYIQYQGKSRNIEVTDSGPNPKTEDRVMLLRKRSSRILHGGNFYPYPISLNLKTISNLGIIKIGKIGFSYAHSLIWPIRDEKSLEDFLINRFGRELYLTFFKDYTEKVWGVTCQEISAEWGAQRIKGLSITKTLHHALKSVFHKDHSINQKKTETTLIEQFLYPKFGPGQMWEEVARKVQEMGGEIHMGYRATSLETHDGIITALTVENQITHETISNQGDYFFSTMPVKELIQAFGDAPNEEVREVATGLMYRDFITVGLLLKKLMISNDTNQTTINNIIPDNWIYIQEKDVKIGRLQVFNNWSPYMVRNPDNVWIGLEYFCNEGDDLWEMSDENFSNFAIEEVERIGIIDRNDVLDHTVIRMPKAYPAYFGTYDRFHLIREFVDTYPNLFLLGRNGMHKYNNADHSMLTAMVAVDNIIGGISDKSNIWSVNTEMEYHEQRNNSV